MPAAPVKAARGITLSPTDGPIDTRITIIGTEFNKSTSNSDKYAAIYFSSEEASTIDDIDVEVTRYKLVREGVWLDEDGDFETTFKVPEVLDDGRKDEDVVSGTYYVYVCHYLGTVIQPRIRAVATFTITMGKITLSPLRGNVGTLVEIKGTEFGGSTDVTVEYDGATIPIASGSKRTSSKGDFTSVIRIPDSTAGSHTIAARVSGDEATATFIVGAEIVINPTLGEAGTTVIASGTGFSKLKTVTIWFYNTKVATTKTNILGSFYVNFNVPDIAAGSYAVDAEGEANLAKSKFRITAPMPSPPQPPPAPAPAPPKPSISISATQGNIGQGLVIGGAGFKPEASVTIKYDNELLNAVTTDSNGVFAAALIVPPGKYGSHYITTSDGVNNSEISFAVESTPPPIPTLLLPKMDDSLKAPIYFDWQDVTDDSIPVTYTFQIARSFDFSDTSIVLEKQGLTKTEYSLTEEERIRRSIGEGAYYWRVRAIDSASNEGKWASPRIFYVATAIMPGWAIYTIAILGGILLLALGYLIHMKTSSPRQ